MLHLIKNEMKVNICQKWIIMFDNVLSNKKMKIEVNTCWKLIIIVDNASCNKI